MNPRKQKGPAKEILVDASPSDDGDGSARHGIPAKPSRLSTSPAWNASKAGFTKVWTNYVQFLAASFKRMTRLQQEDLISRLGMIVTMGVTGLALLLFYPMINRVIRLILVPAALIAAWWVANNIVRAVLLDRLSGILNDPENEDEFVDTVEDEPVNDGPMNRDR